MSSEDPCVGITISAGSSPKLPELYAAALKRQGAEPIFLRPGNVAEAGRCKGLLFPGGKDLAPSFYGKEECGAIEPEDPRRTEFELELLTTHVSSGIPLLGICYGMQLLNVFFGGSLYPDIHEDMPGALNHRGGAHEIRLAGNPFLSNGLSVVNSSHHQSVRNPGRDLVPFAFAPDGIVEAFFQQGHPYCVGVQWHPERMDTSLSVRLFSGFVRTCSEAR